MSPLKTALAALFSLAAAGLSAGQTQFQGYGFNAQVLKSDSYPYREFAQGGKSTLKVRAGEEYSIVVNNPLPVRVAVAVSVDGLNSIDGKRSSPGKARKWIIEPHGSVTVSGWQTGSGSLRKFVFTRDEASYAEWRERKEGKPYAQNLGVIGVAWFWNRAELDYALHPPLPFSENDGNYVKSDVDRLRKSASVPAPSAAGGAASERAGTGMGREQSHPVTEVEFKADSGMYSLADVLKIYYEFAPEPSLPQPFIGEDDEHTRFAPEMPK